MKKQLGLAAIGLAGLTAGAGAGLVLTGGNGAASAQTSDTTVPSTPSTESGPTDPAPDERKGAWLQGVLAPLVEDGTITQAQADAVIAAIDAARPLHRPHGPGMGRHGHGLGLEAAATAIGITAEELREALAGGQTIAQVAEANGVELATVKAAMVDAFKAHQDEAVAQGRKTRAQADADLAAFEDRLDTILTTTWPGRPGDRGAPQDEAPADEAPPTTS